LLGQELDSNPGMVNEAPFGAGWFIKLKVLVVIVTLTTTIQLTDL
jgi:glycine cleavage system H lipoate-binding protein